MLDSCCISIGLVFIKDRPVSSFWVLRFRSRVLRFRDLGVFVFDLGCFVFQFWVLRFPVLGASFSRFGCFVLRSSFSSASFSKLPVTDTSLQVPLVGPDSHCVYLRESLLNFNFC